MPPRYAPTIPLPPYSYVPGHGLPHPVNDPAGHLFGAQHEQPPTPGTMGPLPNQPAARSRTLAATLAANSRWRYALDLFNAGYYWEAHEVWESFWHALGRTTPDARFVQGLIHIAAAAVKIRAGMPAGVRRHAQRARELLGGLEAALPGDSGGVVLRAPGLDSASIATVVDELEKYGPECWHTSRTPVVRVLAGDLKLTAESVASGSVSVP